MLGIANSDPLLSLYDVKTPSETDRLAANQPSSISVTWLLEEKLVSLKKHPDSGTLNAGSVHKEGVEVLRIAFWIYQLSGSRGVREPIYAVRHLCFCNVKSRPSIAPTLLIPHHTNIIGDPPNRCLGTQIFPASPNPKLNISHGNTKISEW